MLSKHRPPDLSIQEQALSRLLGVTPNCDAYFAHIVGRWQGLLGDDLKLKIPRGLCGASLKADPELDTGDANLPLCPRCLLRNAQAPLQTVFPYQLPGCPVRLLMLIAIVTTISAVAVVIALAVIVISGPVETPAAPGPPASVIEASAAQQLRHVTVDVAGARPGRTPAERIC